MFTISILNHRNCLFSLFQAFLLLKFAYRLNVINEYFIIIIKC